MLDGRGRTTARDAMRHELDLPRLLRRAAELDAHTYRLWCEAISHGYSEHWVSRRMAELCTPERNSPGPKKLFRS